MSFDLLAPHYRWMEFVLAGEKLQNCRTAFLDRVAHAKKVLILGEGNGRFLRECRRKLPNAKITCVDSSARMLAAARKRARVVVEDSSHTEFIHADALAWAPVEGNVDLIVTHFFLDCFRPEQLKLLIAKLVLAAAPRANWLLADFQAASSGLQRQRSQIILWMMYRFFRVATRLSTTRLTPPDALLEEQGFELRERQESDWGLLHSDWWQLSNK
jgi:ubiquinone/menaquinone biosynthesis C-methylase UbiE